MGVRDGGATGSQALPLKTRFEPSRDAGRRRGRKRVGELGRCLRQRVFTTERISHAHGESRDRSTNQTRPPSLTIAPGASRLLYRCVSANPRAHSPVAYIYLANHSTIPRVCDFSNVYLHHAGWDLRDKHTFLYIRILS